MVTNALMVASRLSGKPVFMTREYLQGRAQAVRRQSASIDSQETHTSFSESRSEIAPAEPVPAVSVPSARGDSERAVTVPLPGEGESKPSSTVAMKCRGSQARCLTWSAIDTTSSRKRANPRDWKRLVISKGVGD